MANDMLTILKVCLFQNIGDKILPKDAIPDTKEIDNLLSAALDANDNKAFLIFSLVIKMGLTNQEICNLNKEYICRNQTGHLCINMPTKESYKQISYYTLMTLVQFLIHILWLKVNIQEQVHDYNIRKPY